MPDLGKLTPDNPDVCLSFFQREPLCHVCRLQLASAHSILQQLANLPYYILFPAGQRRLLSGTQQPAENGTSGSAGASADKGQRYYYDHVLVPMPKYNAEGLYLTMGGTKMTNEQAAALQYPFYRERSSGVCSTPKGQIKKPGSRLRRFRAIQDRFGRCALPGKLAEPFLYRQERDNASTTQVCELSIYYPTAGNGSPRATGVSNTDIEPVKGGLSNAFKRAASMWGIGRYLYDLKNLWVPLKDGKYIRTISFPY